ncbi:chloramphenicol resistance protein [Clostridium sp. MSJ-8]|uniref:chloramphenicol resistance protein n=1 Tax=Clostridium sp. MSJ-8 TaxID=2841510 RepID=UPI001C0F39AF|nr:chloramphenicol resistance protein [Clostridium sp. MSJ-8]MBU5487023.1 chloramphenicol resistance protein [Clostridium sp. MSJ-8]
MKIIEAIRDYISSLECMKTFDNAINVNYLDSETDNFSIEEIPCNPIIKKYVDESTIRQFQFAFCSREPYGAEIIQNIDNSSFYEDFANEIEDKNNKGILPLLADVEVRSLEVTSSAYAVSVTEDTAMYQINLNLKYFKGVN